MPLIEPTGELHLRVAAIGDIGVIGTARTRAARDGVDEALRIPAATLRAADLGFANLEFPVGDAAAVRPGRSNEFRHDPGIAAALVRAGVGVVSLANNHMLDCGVAGLERTLAECAAAGLPAIGAGRDLAAARAPARLHVAGRRAVVLAYAQTSSDAAGATSPGVAPLDPDLMLEDVARWRPEADVLIVSAHWGSMYVDYPPPRVTALAQQLAAAGVDLVLGHHPHVLQGVERRGRSLVFYSLGDSVFNCRAGDFHAEIAAQTRLQTGVFTALLTAAAPGVEFAPYRLDDDGFPVAPDAPGTAAATARLRELSAGLADSGARFAEQGAPQLLKYELQSMGAYFRQRRFDKIARLLLAVRPRHLPLLWQAVTRGGRAS